MNLQHEFSIEVESMRGVNRLSACLLVMLLANPAGAQTEPSAGMLRYPDVSHDKLVFCYADDLWIVNKEGGIASPLASPAGHEQFPKFNPGGNKIAFVGNYEGNSDLYEIAANGGFAKRITYHPATEQLCDYTAEDQLLYSTAGFARLNRMQQLFTISAAQASPKMLPVPYGTNGTMDAAGEWLAYTPYSRDARTWKRYQGGMASDIWLFHLQDHRSRQVTDWAGTDSFPMWHGENLYYLSDAGPAHRLNIWKYDLESDQSSQVTSFKRFDVKYPSMGPGSDGQGEIVFQVAADLRILDLKSEESRKVEVTIPGDRPTLRPHIVDAAKFIQSAGISPEAKRVTIGARGDIWTVPAEHGSPRNLTRSSGVAERFPAWSPDGRWIAFLSDASGEYELTVIQSDGQGETRQLTDLKGTFRFDPVWSPDSQKIFFCDKGGAMFLHDLDSGETKQFDQDPYSRRGDISWSHDSRWLAYRRNLDSVPRTQIRVLEVDSGEIHEVSSGYFNDDNPVFDRKGDYLYYFSNRDFSSPQYEDVGTTFIYDNTSVLVALPLRADVENPLLPSSDEQEWESSDEEKGDASESSKNGEDSTKRRKNRKKRRKKNPAGQRDMATAEAESGPSESDDDGEGEQPAQQLTIDFDGLEARSFQIPIESGSFRGLGVAEDGSLVYIRTSTKGESGSPSLKSLKIENGKPVEKTILEGVGGFELTPDGKHLLVFRGSSLYILKPAPGQSADSQVSTAGMRVEIDRRQEWKQVFTDAWRIERDFFYDPNMHGVDWPSVRKRYARLLPDCVSRYDLSYIIREMIAELNVGHAYYREGDVERGPSESAGLLGCRFEIEGDQIKFARLWHGGIWDTDARNPLAQAGVLLGDVLLAVEGEPVSAEHNPYQYFQGRAGRSVSLLVQTGDAEPRSVVVRAMSSDTQLRFWDGIETTRAYVEKKSKGKVGYIYVTNTSINGQNDLFRQFYAQQEKAALIIDDRWNGGGQIPTRFIELLNRPATNYWARREGRDWVWPPDSHQGPKCMLINGLAGSGGDMFPALFKQLELGKLIGRRTWGGLVGIQGEPPMIDGSSVTAPSFAYYETDGTWGIEGHGVDPDIEVVDDPAKMQDGNDPQLNRAIRLMLKEIKRYPSAPERPTYPDRSGMGLAEEDK